MLIPVFMQVSGQVMSGMGEGSMYVNKYLPYFESVLGFTCFPGTLNLSLKQKLDLNGAKKFTIEPYDQNLGKVDCYLVRIHDEYDGAIVIPHKTRHGDTVIELIASVDLRGSLQLKDGDTLICELV